MKFRVWHKKLRQFVKKRVDIQDGIDNADIMGCLAVDCEGNLCYDDYGNGMYGVNDPENYIISEFTGLFDRNGVEIYEWDIVSFHGDDESKEFTVRIDEYVTVTSKRFIQTHTYVYGVYLVAEDDELVPASKNMNVNIIDNVFKRPKLKKQKDE